MEENKAEQKKNIKYKTKNIASVQNYIDIIVFFTHQLHSYYSTYNMKGIECQTLTVLLYSLCWILLDRKKNNISIGSLKTWVLENILFLFEKSWYGIQLSNTLRGSGYGDLENYAERKEQSKVFYFLIVIYFHHFRSFVYMS